MYKFAIFLLLAASAIAVYTVQLANKCTLYEAWELSGPYILGFWVFGMVCAGFVIILQRSEYHA